MDERKRHAKGMKARRPVSGERACGSRTGAGKQFHRAFSGPDYTLRLGRNLDTTRAATQNAEHDHDCDDGGDASSGRIAAAFARGSKEWRDSHRYSEVLLQSAIYCGVPAANHAFHLAEEVLEEAAK